MSLLSVIGFVVFLSALHFESGDCTDTEGKCYQNKKTGMCVYAKAPKAPYDKLALPKSCIGIKSGIPGKCNPYGKNTNTCNDLCNPVCGCEKTSKGIRVRKFPSAQDKKHEYGQANKNKDGTPKNGDYVKLPLCYCNKNDITDWVYRTDVECN